jgi:hypothetical protein
MAVLEAARRRPEGAAGAVERQSMSCLPLSAIHPSTATQDNQRLPQGHRLSSTVSI